MSEIPARDALSPGAAAAQRAAEAIRGAVGSAAPSIALILGSGLGGLAERLDGATRIAFADVPGFPRTGVAGHAGAVVAGKLHGRDVIVLAGRFHLYEGHDIRVAGLPVRVMHALGIRTLLVSNAAGGIRRTLRPGDLMILADHINLMFRNPLTGPTERGDERFPDMSEPYDGQLRQTLAETGRAIGLRLHEGVYAGLTGPSYETPAEVRMLDRIGADAVGMSTIPEVLTARAVGMRVVGISCITNLASGLSRQPLSHTEVLETTMRVQADFERLIRAFVARV
ncbi:MAG: purine-nucleoside phosphorylase [Gemmatimonadaceae bacterium]